MSIHPAGQWVGGAGAAGAGGPGRHARLRQAGARRLAADLHAWNPRVSPAQC